MADRNDAVSERGCLHVVASGGGVSRNESVVVEEPLEIRVDGESLFVTMRTPGDDYDLAFGLLYTEGILSSARDVASIAHCPSTEGHSDNVVTVVVAAGADVRLPEFRRRVPISSACGLCGKESIDAIRARCMPIDDATKWTSRAILQAIRRMAAAQTTFAATGGLHAAGLFTDDGALEVVREDVGRHNAADKVIGAMLRRGAVAGGCVDASGRLDLRARLMTFSGRAGFEMVQKAAIARVAVVASVSAPSTLAIDLAAELGVTLIAFAREDRLNVYTHTSRIDFD